MPPRLSVSDSEDSESENQRGGPPSDAQLERALRDTVAKVFRSGNLEDLTVKRVRAATEKALGLEEGFFKGHERWKAESDRIIRDEVEIQEAKQDEESQPEPEPERKPEPKAQPETEPAKEEDLKAKKPTKREPPADLPKPKKRRKSSEPPDSERVHSSDLSDHAEAESSAESPTDTKKEPSEGVDESDSEMSVLKDEAPKPKKRQKSAEPASKKGKRKAKTAATEDMDPDQAEIKRLQGWLVKCGIRKMWHRELAPYDTPKAKIKHLKQMLEDAGMKGRYSLEKAKKIREERELQADLEAVKEGASRWGAGEADDGKRRRTARGRQALAFLEDEDDESE